MLRKGKKILKLEPKGLFIRWLKSNYQFLYINFLGKKSLYLDVKVNLNLKLILISIKKICCIGAGYVGGPTMAVFAKNCPNIEFEVVDINQERINAWNSNDFTKLPVFEPGLSEIIELVRGKNLIFSTNVHNALRKADMIFISVNTPIKRKGLGAGETSDLRWVESCARQISEIAEDHTIVVETVSYTHLTLPPNREV